MQCKDPKVGVPNLTRHRTNMTNSTFRRFEGLLKLLGNSYFRCFVTSILMTSCIIVYKTEVSMIHAFENVIFRGTRRGPKK